MTLEARFRGRRHPGQAQPARRRLCDSSPQNNAGRVHVGLLPRFCSVCLCVCLSVCACFCACVWLLTTCKDYAHRRVRPQNNRDFEVYGSALQLLYASLLKTLSGHPFSSCYVCNGKNLDYTHHPFCNCNSNNDSASSSCSKKSITTPILVITALYP